jgi:hypothetical protein
MSLWYCSSKEIYDKLDRERDKYLDEAIAEALPCDGKVSCLALLCYEGESGCIPASCNLSE